MTYFSADLDAKKTIIAEALYRRLSRYEDDLISMQLLGMPFPESVTKFDSVSYSGAISSGVDQLLDEVFDPWKEMADPGYWANAYTNVSEAIKNLVPPGVDGYEKGEISAAGISNPDSSIPGYAQDVKDSISGWWGETANSFKKSYVNKFGWIIGIQANVGKILEKAAKAEGDAYEAAQRNLLDLMDDFADAINSMGTSGGVEGKNFAIGVGAAAAGVIGTMALPIEALAAVAVLSGGITVVNDFKGKFGGKETAAVLEGSNITRVWNNLKSHLHTIREEVQETEKALHDVLNEVWGALGQSVRIGPGESSAESDDDLIPAMDLLMPPAPAFVSTVEAAASGKNSKEELGELQRQITGEVKDGADNGDQVEPPGGGYSPEPIDS
jgi:hypothetical protein